MPDTSGRHRWRIYISTGIKIQLLRTRSRRRNVIENYEAYTTRPTGQSFHKPFKLSKNVNFRCKMQITIMLNYDYFKSHIINLLSYNYPFILQCFSEVRPRIFPSMFKFRFMVVSLVTSLLLLLCK